MLWIHSKIEVKHQVLFASVPLFDYNKSISMIVYMIDGVDVKIASQRLKYKLKWDDNLYRNLSIRVIHTRMDKV